MKLVVLTLSLLAALPAAAGNLYRWVDSAGRVHYSDQVPPPKAKNATQKSFKGNVIETGESYALRQAKEHFPVVLYTAAGCGPACEMGQQLLDKRGTPYSTKNVDNNVENQKALHDLTGSLKIPTLVVGSQKVTGFEDGQWNSMLDAAGYPNTPARNAPKAAPPKAEDKSPPTSPAQPSY
ncbi:MAG TPA: glutaredoxin family protein [Thiobacillaceae bacterium]|nr:glutaredoxin family protein [Thiobacillaceae bacterium]